MIPFRERNKTVIGAIGIVTITAMLGGAFSLDARREAATTARA